MPPRVTVEVAVPDLRMLLQKSNASAVWPSNASSPHSDTSGCPNCLGLKAAASTLAMIVTARIKECFMLIVGGNREHYREMQEAAKARMNNDE